MKKAQVSFEFTMAIVIGMILMLTLLAVFANKMHDVVNESKQRDAETILDILGDEVVFAKGAIPGYTRVFDLPISIEGENYSVDLQNGYFVVTHAQNEYVRAFPFMVNGSICLGDLNTSTRIFEVQRSEKDVTVSSCPDCLPNFYSCDFYANDLGDCNQGAIDLGIDFSSFRDQCEERYCVSC